MWDDHNMAAGLGEAAFLCIDGVFVRDYGAFQPHLTKTANSPKRLKFLFGE